MGNISLEFIPIHNIGNCSLTVDLLDSFGDGWNGYVLLVDGGGFGPQRLSPWKFLSSSDAGRKMQFVLPLKLGYVMSLSLVYGGSSSDAKKNDWLPREYWEVYYEALFSCLHILHIMYVILLCFLLLRCFGKLRYHRRNRTLETISQRCNFNVKYLTTVQV